MDGQAVLLALLLTFLALPVRQMYVYHQRGQNSVRWVDVFWLITYIVVGMTVMVRLRPLLLG